MAKRPTKPTGHGQVYICNSAEVGTILIVKNKARVQCEFGSKTICSTSPGARAGRYRSSDWVKTSRISAKTC
jgi:hypothetical protein